MVLHCLWLTCDAEKGRDIGHLWQPQRETRDCVHDLNRFRLGDKTTI